MSAMTSYAKFGFVLLLVAAGYLAPPNARASAIFPCNPTAVMDWGSTILVDCKNSIVVNGQTITRLAYNNPSATTASRFIAFAQAAILSGEQQVLAWIPDTGTSFLQCDPASCRVPEFIGFGK